MIAGAGAGLVSSVLTCPLDVVKTKLQAQGGPIRGQTTYRGLFGSFATIWAEEGIRGLYRGLGPTIFGYLPTWAIYFAVYDAAKPTFADMRSSESSSPFSRGRTGQADLSAGRHDGGDDVVAHIAAAVTAGATSTVATNPLWVIKTRFMTQRVVGAGSEEAYRHTLHAFRRIWSEEGIAGFYRGLAPSLLGVSHVVIQFPVYERIKAYFREQQGGGPDLPSSKILVASAASKMLASVITYPHEVIRTRLQISRASSPSSDSRHRPPSPSSSSSPPHSSSRPPPPPSPSSSFPRPSHSHPNSDRPPGLVATFRSILHNEGPSGFYRGMGVNLVRTVPNSALTILTYELVAGSLHNLTSSPSSEVDDR